MEWLLGFAAILVAIVIYLLQRRSVQRVEVVNPLVPVQRVEVVNPREHEEDFLLVEYRWFDREIIPAQRAEGWEVKIPRFEKVAQRRLEGWDYVFLSFDGRMRKIGIGGTPQMPELVPLRQRASPN